MTSASGSGERAWRAVDHAAAVVGLLTAASALISDHVPRHDRRAISIAIVIVGVALAVAGGWNRTGRNQAFGSNRGAGWTVALGLGVALVVLGLGRCIWGG